jgi:SNF2 family DNA or RNA helicase
VRTYGTATLAPKKGYWRIECEPQVRMRLKNMFRQIDPDGKDALRVSNTDQNCRDLEWFCSRYPLVIKPEGELERRARAYDERINTAAEILSGNRPPPDFRLALPPRDYQKQAAALALTSGGLLLADELGLGKTVTAICVLASEGSVPALVVCPVHIQRQWKAQIEKFAPGLRVHIFKKGSPYSLTDKKTGLDPDVMVCSYAKLRGWASDLAGKVRCVVYDEVQELRKQGSEKWAAAQMISEQAERRLGLSATPIYNYGGEFYSVFECLRPAELGTQTEFLREWCVDSLDKDKAQIKEPKTFGAYLRESALMLRRTRADVSRELPACSRIVHHVDSDAAAFDDVETAATELARIIVSQTGGFEQMKASSDFSTTMRQATGIAKAKYVAEFVRMLLDNGEPVVLFGWHRAVYTLWEEAFRHENPAWYTGSESPAAKDRAIQDFTSGYTNLLIMSLRSGAGVDGLQHRCATLVFGELDWAPGAMDQCVGRLHRDGQQRPVAAYYLTAADGCDPYMIDVLGVKREQMEGVRDPDAELVEALEVDPDHVRKLAEGYLARKGAHR